MIPTVSEPDPPPGRPAGPADPAGPGDPPASGDGMREFIARLRGSKRIGGDVVHVETLPAEPAAFAPFAAPLPAPLEGALRALGIDPPWTHQAEAIDRIRRGEDVLTVTPTASGKSLIYLVPTFASALERPGSRSLYLFPYKALAQDQLQGIEELSIEVALRGGRNRDSGHPIRAAIYDGDTSDARRREIRAEPPDILITNPDMLHLGILPYHESWRPFFETLDHIVIDELHVYRGIFGSHLHHILKRLMRVAALSGRRPRVIASSATVAQPGRMGEALVGRRFAVVDKSGAPRAERHLMLLNPSGSPYTAATAIVDAALEAGFRTIAFTKARKITELLHSWLLQSAPRWRGKVSSYRSGYLPEERRDIERRLFSGDLRGVISTSALELGVDIGGLDVCVLVGYPGSIVSTWQRIGRVGREDRPALTVLVALPDALDQYFMSHPAQLTTRGFEEVVFDPLNPEVARAHLVCAGSEIPIEAADGEIYSEPEFALVRALEREGRLALDAEGERWYARRRRPHRDINLRSTGSTYSIADERTGRVIGTIDGVRAFHETHAGAVYLHHGQQFLVRALDIDNRRVTVERADLEYYTQVRGEKETAILEALQERSAGPLEARLGRLRVTERITGFEKRRLHGRDRLGIFELRMPPILFETVGLWMALPDALPDVVRERGGDFMGAIHAAEHAMISLFPLLAICDRGDIGGISYPFHPEVGGPAIFIYDGHPGGVGLSARGFRDLETLLARTAELLRGCACEIGCPSCVQSPKCGNGNQPLDKAGALLVLEALLGRVPLPAGRRRTPALRAGATEPAPARPLEPVPEVPAPAVAPIPSAGAGPPLATLFFDLETQKSAEEVGGWQNIAAMKVALAVTYDDRTGRFRTYHEKDVNELLLDLLTADRVVGYNIDRFDIEVLRGYTGRDLSHIRTRDMLADIHRLLGFRLRLADIAEATLGTGKSADGLQSLQWWKEGRLDLIEEYCRRDVEVTANVFRYGADRGYILYRDKEGRALRLPVDWK
ncbi:MAG TPA: DEAD/DEAH box helicase [Verrucomicrobiae bacterium]|nr:DEAD/DEAH box helicase [Verrucomicrobiae bacterium]